MNLDEQQLPPRPLLLRLLQQLVDVTDDVAAVVVAAVAAVVDCDVPLWPAMYRHLHCVVDTEKVSNHHL